MTDASRPSDPPSIGVSGGTSASSSQHRAAAPRNVRVAVLTISDTRTPETDTSGQYLLAELKAAGHQAVHYRVVRDDAVDIRSALVLFVREATVVLTTGGTGLTGRDVTVPVVESMITKPIPGFGELFRMLSYSQIGGAAMLSRALGGLCRSAAIFAMPGSLNAVKTAWEGILRDEIGHLAFEIERHGQPGVLAPAQSLMAQSPLAQPLATRSLATQPLATQAVAAQKPPVSAAQPLAVTPPAEAGPPAESQVSLLKPTAPPTTDPPVQPADTQAQQARGAAAGTAKLGRHQKEPQRL